MSDLTGIHDQLQVAIAESWHGDDRDSRKKHAMQASKLAAQLYRLAMKSAQHRREA